MRRMKTMLDWLPALAFVAAYVVYDIYVATMVLIGALFLAVAVHRLHTGEWHKTNLVAACVALVLGGLTLWIRDPLFIKLKPTVVYAVFSVILIGSHFIGDKPLMARIPPTMIALPDWLWARVNAAWGNFYADTADTLRAAAIRPRHNGYIAFQTAASAHLRDAFSNRRPAAQAVDELARMFHASIEKAQA